MARHQGSVLVDTNVILECHWTGSWRALTSGYQVETVEDCVTETQTGRQQQREQQQIDPSELRESLKAIHRTSQHEQVKLARASGIDLGQGEKSLWAHARYRKDDWVLCGPDKASLLLGVRLGFREHLVSLEELLDAVGYRPKGLREAFTQKWHKGTISQLVTNECIETR